MEGAAFIVHGALEESLNQIEKEKEAREYARLAPAIEKALAEGKFVVVESTWMLVRDPIGDVAGYHELENVPKFKFLGFRTGKTYEEAQNPPPTGPTMSAAGPVDPAEQSKAEMEAYQTRKELEERAYRYLHTFEGPVMVPESAKRNLYPPLLKRPNLANVAGEYTGGGAPHDLLLTPRGDGLELTAWNPKTQRTYPVREQSWTWGGEGMGLLKATLVDPESQAAVETYIAVMAGVDGTSVVEVFITTGPDGQKQQVRAERHRR
jgi:hypothetical protein